MLPVWDLDPAFPSYSELKRMKDCDLSSELREILKNSHPSDRCAVKKMISYVSITRGIRTRNVLLTHLLEPDVGQAAIAYRSHWRQLSKVFQRFLNEHTGRRSVPLGGRRYLEYHPLLLDWLEVKERTTKHVWHIRSIVMQFLSWVTTTYYTTYTPQDFPVVLLERDIFLFYRQNLLRRAQRKKHSRVYLKRHLAVIVEWARWLVSEHEVSDINLNKLAISNGTNRQRKVPNDQEIERLVNTAIHLGLHLIALILLLITATGARPSEIISLRMNDLNMAERRLRLQSKQGPERKIRLSEELWTALVQHVDVAFNDRVPDDEQRVFLNSKGRPLEYPMLKYYFCKVQRVAGTKLDGLMSLRHRFATDCLEAHVPTRVFQYLMGHVGTSEKGRYQHVKENFYSSEIQLAFSKVSWRDEFHA